MTCVMTFHCIRFGFYGISDDPFCRSHSGTRHLKEEFHTEPISIHDVQLCAHIWWHVREGDSLASWSLAVLRTHKEWSWFRSVSHRPIGKLIKQRQCGSYAQYTNSYYRSFLAANRVIAVLRFLQRFESKSHPRIKSQKQSWNGDFVFYSSPNFEEFFFGEAT